MPFVQAAARLEISEVHDDVIEVYVGATVVGGARIGSWVNPK